MKNVNTGVVQFQHNDTLYEVWHDCRLEQAFCNDENIEIDSVKARQAFAKCIIQFLNEKLDINLIYKSMYFPNDYSFYMDEIITTYDIQDYIKIENFVMSSDALALAYLENVDQATKAYSGYMPLYTKDQVFADMDLKLKLAIETLIQDENFNADFECWYEMQCCDESLESAVTYAEDGSND